MRSDGGVMLLAITTILLLVPNIPFFSTISTGIEESDRIIDPIPTLPRDAGAGVFIENKGQWDPSILFVTDTGYGKAGFMNDGIIHYIIRGKNIPSIPFMNFPGYGSPYKEIPEGTSHCVQVIAKKSRP